MNKVYGLSECQSSSLTKAFVILSTLSAKFYNTVVTPSHVEGSRLALSDRGEGKGRDSFTPLRFVQNDKLNVQAALRDVSV